MSLHEVMEQQTVRHGMLLTQPAVEWWCLTMLNQPCCRSVWPRPALWPACRLAQLCWPHAHALCAWLLDILLIRH